MLNKFKNRFANRGKILESQIERMCEIYESLDIAHIRKIPTPIKMVKRFADGSFKAFFEKKSTVDFEGFDFNGMHICFDAKETKAKSFSFSAIQEHQFRYLSFARRCGARAFVYVRFSQFSTDYTIDIGILEELKKDGKKSIKLENMPLHGNKVINLDFLREL